MSATFWDRIARLYDLAEWTNRKVHAAAAARVAELVPVGARVLDCAAKMENAIKKLPGVTDATVSFLTQKMTIEADDIDAVMKDVVKCCKKVEPDCEIVL